MGTYRTEQRNRWWQSGHLHNRENASKTVDFRDGWADYFDAYAKNYEKNAFSGPGLEVVSAREVKAMVSGMSEVQGGRILEIGSGEGRLTMSLLNKGYQVQATDGAPGMIEFLSENHPETNPLQMLLSGEKIPFENSSFDGVAGLRVWKYVNQRNRVLSELRRVVKTGGVITLEWSSSAGAARFGYKGSSVNLLNRSTVETELRAAGFDVVRHTTTSRLPQPVWLMSSSMTYASALNKLEDTIDRVLRRVAGGTFLGRSVVTVAKAA